MLTHVDNNYSFEFKYKMNQQAVTNLESKVNSGEANISTSESTHFKPTRSQLPTELLYPIKNKPQLLHLSQLEEPNTNTQKEQGQQDTCNRLFTFMDEREVERKIIQNYIFKNKSKRESVVEAKTHSQNSRNERNIVEMFHQQRKKRQDILKKIVNQTTLKTEQSHLQLKKISQNRTPKHLPYIENNCQSFQQKNKSKTPRLNNIKQNTPVSNIQVKLFRAKSNLDKQNIRSYRNSPLKICKPKKQTTQNDIIDVQNFETFEKKIIGGEKELMKKKKQLEKQLLVINQSLLFCKKINNINNRNKKPKQAPITQRKKSKLN